MNIKNLTKILISFQALFEKLGKTSRTVDTELESQIENLRDTQRKYGNVLRLARALTSHFYHVIQTQVSTYYRYQNKLHPNSRCFVPVKFMPDHCRFLVPGNTQKILMDI